MIFCITVFLFQKGFLLSREALPDKTVCFSKVKNDSCYRIPKQYSKAVVVIIDALKYDFAVYNKNLESVRPYQNAMPIIDKLVGTGQGRLFLSYADPPTTTMQRLKGMVTGSIPTFIDISANFASYEIDEDNIIDQLIDNGQRVVFVGDDTWVSLLPNRFTRTFAFPSFDVWDLDTVDRGVEKHLFQELSRPQTWDVLIAHFLGVDHAGHKFGPDHSEMRRKLTEMNSVIERLVQEMPEDCVLFVMGDHGMTMTGDHGGDSEDELRSALFIYSNSSKTDAKADTFDRISQIDFVPTFSLLMGLPIPFSNIGKVIHEVFLPNGLRQLQFLKINVEQVFTYLSKYRLLHSDSLPRAVMDSIEGQKSSFMNKTAIKPNEVTELLKMGVDLLSSAKKICEATFVEFDLWHIWMGLTFSSLHISLMVVLSLDKIFLKSVVSPKLMPLLIAFFAAGAGLCCVVMEASLILKISYLAAIFAGVTLPACGLIVLWRIRYSVGQVLATVLAHTESFSLFFFGLALFMCSALFSNSYVVEEAQVNSYVVMTLFLAHMLRNNFMFKSSRNMAMSTFILAVLACVKVYFRCREEQHDYCPATDFYKPIGTLNASVSKTYIQWRFFSSMFSLLVLVVGHKCWLSRCGNLNGMSLPVIIAKCIPAIIGVTLVFYWALQALSPEMASKLLTCAWQHNFLALFVYAMCLISIFILAVKPHLIYCEKEVRKMGKEMPKLYDGVSSYYHMMKTNWKEHFSMSSMQGTRPIVYGIGTAISAAFLSIGIFVSLLSILILGDGLSPSIVLAYFAIIAYLYLTSHQRLSEATTLFELMHVPWTSVIGYDLMCSLFFYGTSHQPTFPTIQWGAAFVGFSGANYGGTEGLGLNYWLPALLIGWNTFAARLLFAFMLPLLLVAPFMFYMNVEEMRKACEKMPSAATELLSQGEVVLIEQRDDAKAHMFRLCIKYSVILGVRMLSSMLAAALHRRHLMVWKIFAPRFIFEAVGFGVSLFAMCLSYLVFIRVQKSLSRYLIELSTKKDK